MNKDSLVERQLPEYERPPLMEVIFGLQFAPLTSMKPPHVGLFWDVLGREKYPELEQRPPLAHTIESEAGKPQQPTIIETGLEYPPLSRCFFVNSVRNHLVQLQIDRLLQNWRKLESSDDYPRYNKLFPRFTETVDKLGKFVTDEKIGKLRADQYELTYMNHILKGQGWDTLDDMSKVFPWVTAAPGKNLLAVPDTVSWGRSFRLPDEMGRLHISMQTGMSKEDGERLLSLTLTARGYSQDMSAWFKTAHEWIVNGFTELTASEIQKTVWRRKV